MDDRVKATDTSVFQIESVEGTGFIIDDHIIATAAHCVYNRETKQVIKDLTIDICGELVAGKSVVLERIKAAEIHVPLDFIVNPELIDSTRFISMYDFALIYV